MHPRRAALWRALWTVTLIVTLFDITPAFGKTITVTSTADSGAGSLRDAIASASNGDMINFSLQYPASITVLTPLTFGPSLTITGPGATNLAIDGGNSVVVILINAGATVAISGVAIQRGGNFLLGGGIFNAGTLTLTDSAVSNNAQGTQLGGGIFNAGTLTLDNCTVTGNFVDANNIGLGGGIYNSGGSVTLNNSIVSKNFGIGSGSYGGGGIYNDGGLVAVTNSTVSDNALSANATGGNASGGGIANVHSGSLIITNSTVSGNSANGSSATGGGIANGLPTGHGSLRLINSTVSGNTVEGSGGGGGIWNDGVTTAVNSTVFGNSATFGASGGGIYNSQTLKLSNSTVSSNSVSTAGDAVAGGIRNLGGMLTIKNSILANNNVNCAATSGTNTSGGHNLSDDGTCANFFNQFGDLNNTPARLDTGGLKSNGGPTKTVGLQTTSAALNAIPLTPTNFCTDASGNPVTTDQRGVPRPEGPACDIGAYESYISLHFQTQAIQTLILSAQVLSLPIDQSTQQDLINPLQAALDSMNRGVVNPAINQLGAFVNDTNSLIRDQILTSQQAAPLITSAQQVITGLQGN